MFHERLRALREKENLTQKQLSEILKISRSSLSSYETGAREPDFNMLKDIASYFNVTIDYLLDFVAKDEDKQKTTDTDEQIYNQIECLNEASKEELQKYINLLKISQIYKNDESTIYQNRKANA